MTSLQCINCNVRLSRRRRHALSNDGEDIVNTNRLWTYLRDLHPEDKACVRCWLRVRTKDTSPNEDIQPVEPYQQESDNSELMCAACGQSLTPDNTACLLEHQQTPSINEVCEVCWGQVCNLNFYVPDGLCCFKLK
ncbi:uncharacterized protein LOC126912746 [Spodoptera frugiperda]|uniref:Uncharacterized protein LOC126912746 n=1 Tax=Spodoptera frugiperda TaxID=7108 RepID=A0A9R0EB86_SPOFR|nr:uncharacterized protein LOC126912746 [Spodoptera frugiperda]